MTEQELTEQELREKIAYIVDPYAFIPDFGDPDMPLRKAGKILALIKEAGYKHPREIFDQITQAKRSGWDDCEKWYKANGYVRLAEDQSLPDT